MKYLIILALLGSIGCGEKIHWDCETKTEVIEANEGCNEEDEFCAMIETTKETCKELDLNVFGI